MICTEGHRKIRKWICNMFQKQNGWDLDMDQIQVAGQGVVTEKETSRIIARFLALENGWIVMLFLRWGNLRKKCIIWEDCYILFFKKNRFYRIYLFMFGSSGSSWLHAGSSLAVVPEPRVSFSWCGAWALRPQASRAAALGLSSCDLWLSCPEACGIFLDQ